MPHTLIDLKRQFTPWTEKDGKSIDAYFAARHSFFTKDWQHILEEFRVVILAEAGSGKTEELKARTRSLQAEGKTAFYATVQDVARDGLDSATGEAAKVSAWRNGNQPAWLFIDSVDEAKLDGIRLETALRKIADGIEGARSRAHIIISGRYTDWEFRADLARLEHYLPVAGDQADLSPPSSDAILIATLDYSSRRKEKKEAVKALVVLMAPLDEERVRGFARGKNIKDLDAFIQAIGDGNLWAFARRPMDLDWLTAYWLKHNRFGTLAAMIEASLTERLRETNLTRRPKDAIATDAAMRAAERIGAAMVFGRSDKLLIPDSEVRAPTATGELDIAHILLDWSEDHRNRLLTRAIFDPATFGRIRLHNDNEGNVRSFLTARWLVERRKANCSWQTLKDMLFAESYGISVIKPSLQKTAAWLSIWDKDVAREVLARGPELLLTAGDPASLPLDTQREALTTLAKNLLANGEHLSFIDLDCLRRFSTPDLVPDIQALWREHKSHEEVRILLLRMIWLGRLSGCDDIVEEAAFGSYYDKYTQVFSGRALLAAANASLRQRYADHIRDTAEKLPAITVWEALEKLYPAEIDTASLLNIIARIPDDARSGVGDSLEYHGPNLVLLVHSRTELELLTNGLLDQLGDRIEEYEGSETAAEKAYFPSIDAAAHALMALAKPDEAPAPALRAAFRIGERRFYRNRQETPEVWGDLHTTVQRREIAFWAAVDHFNGDRRMNGKPIEHESQLEIMGWSPDLKIEDADWLLAAISARTTFEDRSLALQAVFRLWHFTNQPKQLLTRIEKAAAIDARLEERLRMWREPRKISPAEERLNKQVAANRAKHAKQEAKRNKSWIDFVAKIKADPDQLRRLPLTKSGNVDGRLFYLWELLHSMDDYRSQYAIEDTSALIPITGKEVADAERDGLIAMWRQWVPKLESERPAESRNSYSKIDCMGIAGVTLEAEITPGWPKNLTSTDAKLAAKYGTLELNGFPKWMPRLAEAFPQEVCEILIGEIRSELDDASENPRYAVLHDISYGPRDLARIVAPPLLDEVKKRPTIKPANVTLALRALAKGVTDEGAEFYALCIDRFRSCGAELEGDYFAAAFRIDPVAATEVLGVTLDSMKPKAQTLLALRVLPKLFGDRITEEEDQAVALPFDALQRLVLLAYQTIRVEEDNYHPPGVPFSSDTRDSAERSRSLLFNLFAGTRGRATFESLMRMAKLNDFPIPPQRLIEIAHHRAAEDAEHSPWESSEAYALEKECDTSPVTPEDLQRVGLRRIADIQHDLLHADFAQGLTLKAMPSEREVQKWAANELNNRRGRAYSVERESHVADEKEPDIRLRAKVSDASVPIEIKVAESWSLTELEEALDIQLAGRYLRDKDAKRGVLLLVHLMKRTRGWPDAKRRALSFEAVVAHLQAKANNTAAGGPMAPQAEIAVLNVSELSEQKKGTAKRSRRATGKGPNAGKTGANSRNRKTR